MTAGRLPADTKMDRIIYLCSFLTLLFNSSCSFSPKPGQTEQPFFRKDYHYIESVENFYKVHTKPKTWVDAKERCEWEGTTLYYPSTEAEANAVNAYVKETLHIDKYWVGITSLLSDDIFLTIDGLSLMEVYAKWFHKRQDDMGDDENCLEHLVFDEGLNDSKCSNKKPFICKKKLASLEWNSACQMPYTDYIYNETLGKCYKLHHSRKTWTKAYAICSSELSYLAIVDSQDEAKFFMAELTKRYQPENYMSTVARLGIHNKFGQGWKTVKDTPAEKTGYFVGKGLPVGIETACGGITKDGWFHYGPCEHKYMFICEHEV